MSVDNFEDFVIQIKTKEVFEEEGNRPGLKLLETYPFIEGHFVIVRSPSINMFYMEIKGKGEQWFDFYGDYSTKMSIKEGRKKHPYLFI
jgi:hypothetical protein